MVDIDLLLDRYNPSLFAKKITENLKQSRIKRQFTQEELAERSGVTLSSLKRFEQKAEISLSNLLKLAIALDALETFESLFIDDKPSTLDEFLSDKESKNRKRVRKK